MVHGHCLSDSATRDERNMKMAPTTAPSHAESFWWWQLSIICMYICGLTQVKWNLVACVGTLVSAWVACCVSVTSWLCECYQLILSVLLAGCVSVTGWLCQCYQLVGSVLPADCIIITGWLGQCYHLVGLVLPAGCVSVTSWLCLLPALPFIMCVCVEVGGSN